MTYNEGSGSSNLPPTCAAEDALADFGIRLVYMRLQGVARLTMERVEDGDSHLLPERGTNRMSRSKQLLLPLYLLVGVLAAAVPLSADSILSGSVSFNSATGLYT